MRMMESKDQTWIHRQTFTILMLLEMILKTSLTAWMSMMTVLSMGMNFGVGLIHRLSMTIVRLPQLGAGDNSIYSFGC